MSGSNSGIVPSGELVNEIGAFMKRDSEHRAVLLKVSDDGKGIVADKWIKKNPDETWDEFCQLFDTTTCRWAIYMVPVYITGNEGPKDEKAVGISWIGESSKVGPRMKFGSTTTSFIQKIQALDSFKTIDCLSDLQEIQEICDDKLKKQIYAGK